MEIFIIVNLDIYYKKNLDTNKNCPNDFTRHESTPDLVNMLISPTESIQAYGTYFINICGDITKVKHANQGIFWTPKSMFIFYNIFKQPTWKNGDFVTNGDRK